MERENNDNRESERGGMMLANIEINKYLCVNIHTESRGNSMVEIPEHIGSSYQFEIVALAP